ncbi:cysteine proteinase inhibitor 5-like [Momordica charantia]|uniref:Cysteine proteinase inhibitor 5-like n=1 Tax=Momordica charantia TaxID=3673 RepID=A0A6J1BX23_MOMCH|nr:cysteine proteinase inhibitor 5-like [Momordica charantia]
MHVELLLRCRANQEAKPLESFVPTTLYRKLGMDSVAVAPAQNDALQHVKKPGGWEPIKNIKDPYVQEMGRFAVMEQPKPVGLVASMEFVGVVSGEIQLVAAGKEYRLVVEVKVTEKIIVHGCPVSSIRLYVAVVLDKPSDKSWKVLSFAPLELPVGLGHVPA